MVAAPAEVDIPTSHGTIPGLLWMPEDVDPGSQVPGLVVLQEIFGLSGYLRQRCADLAGLGYAVLAPQLFARLDPPVEAVPEEGIDPQQMLADGIDLAGRTDWAQAVRDGLGALDELSGTEGVGQVGLLGFCFGGGLAFHVAAVAARAGRPAAALVSFYGSALPGLLAHADHVTCPSLHVFGTEDTYLPMEQVRQIREAVTAGGTREQVRFELHEGAGHAFDNPHPMFHHAQASAAAWEQTKEFLAAALPA